MARQYLPFTLFVQKLPLIIYPVKDENPLTEIYDRNNPNAISDFLQTLYQRYPQELGKGDYHIVFVWNLEGKRMTDVWLHFMKNWSDSGPLLECLTFEELEITHETGIASGDSIITLAREEELRRSLPTLKEYVDRSKHQPIFPAGLQPNQNFFEN